METVLITGGTGLIGKALHKKLSDKGYRVIVLSRSTSENKDVFKWDLESAYIEEEAIKQVNYIIHLAGAGITDKRWTDKRKEEILRSRILTTKLLYKYVKQYNPNLNAFISASGVGYYGSITSGKIYTENDSAGNDFLAEVCVRWEKESLKFQQLKIRTVNYRTGIVLSKNGGALPKLTKPIKLGVGAAVGSGNQYMPWIHIEDLCNMYISAIENENYNGIYNAVAPEHTTNKQLTKAIANTLKKSIWLPNIPAFAVKAMFGEMAMVLLKGSRVSSEKIKENGFTFKYKSLKKALGNLLN